MDFQIGWLAGQTDGSFKGVLRTLTIHDQIALRPADGEARGSAQRYDVLIGSGALMGHAVAEADGIKMHLHSPELRAPIIATVVPSDTADEWLLSWRPPETQAGR